jgi:DNA-binding NarL/FixJ family response regulator
MEYAADRFWEEFHIWLALGERAAACTFEPVLLHITDAPPLADSVNKTRRGNRSIQVQSHAVLVVDDHSLMQTAIADTLSELDSPIHVQPAGSIGEALKQLSQEQFDLAVLDLALPDTVGFEGLKRLRSRHPEVSVVVCSGRIDYRNVYQALDLRASGFIPKSFGRYNILEALRKARSGNVYLPDIEGESIRRAMPPPSLPFAAQAPESGPASQLQPAQ